MKRSVLLSAIFLLLFLMAMRAAMKNPWIGTRECLSDPEHYHGVIVEEFNEAMVGTVYADGFDLIQKGLPVIRVYSDTSGLKRGEFVGLRAVFDKRGTLAAVSIQPAKNRRYKIWLSLLPVFAVTLLFFRHFKIRFHPLMISEKFNA